ncbi:MAG: hypothetical protein Kow0047_33800 [Anaerolineae bacterium]
MASTIPTTQPATPRPTERTTSESFIDRDSHFDGLYRTKQNLKVEGIAEGEIECEGTLTVAQGARVSAKVTARNITVAGELKGEVVCQETFQILPTGQVEATVTARRLIVQEGGFYNGEFHMIEEPAPSARRATSAQRTPSAEDWLAGFASESSEAEEE